MGTCISSVADLGIFGVYQPQELSDGFFCQGAGVSGLRVRVTWMIVPYHVLGPKQRVGHEPLGRVGV